MDIRDKIAKEFEMMCLADKTHCDGSCRECGLGAADAILAIEHPSEEVRGDICPQHDLDSDCDGVCAEYYNDCHKMRPATIADWSKE